MTRWQFTERLEILIKSIDSPFTVSEEIPPRTDASESHTDSEKKQEKQKANRQNNNVLKNRQVKSVDENDYSTDSESSKSSQVTEKSKNSTKVTKIEIKIYKKKIWNIFIFSAFRLWSLQL